ncbi:MAG TPA: protein-glutamate O-methyltransferase CheR [Polyangiaceae bacterium]
MTPDETTEEIEVNCVLEAIYSRYGYDFREYAPESIHRRVLTIMAKVGVAHLGELMHRLLTEPRLFAAALDDLTVQVSDMFRDPTFYRSFRERVVPTLRTYPNLKIWHAGCSSGEEVYASAIVLLEEGLYDRAQIYATDLNNGALDRARDGVYPGSSIAAFAANYEQSGGLAHFEDYCTRAYGKVAIKDSLRRKIVFFQHDLVSDYAPGEMHVVFCRNVLIYFAPQLRERVLTLFSQSLRRGGFLCLGASEGLTVSAANKFEGFVERERIYRCMGQP